jgi:hypothetical protein
MLDSVRLAEKYMRMVAVTGWHDRLYLAWVGSLHSELWSGYKLALAYSLDGREIIGKQRLNQKSYGMMTAGGGGSTGPGAGPSLAVSGEQLYLAWTGTDHRISILADPQSPHGAPIRLEEARSKTTPALCSHQGSLVLAWTGTDGRINILTGPEGPHGAPVQLEEAWSGDGPALCSHQGSLVLAWTGRDGTINILTGPEGPHGAPVRLEKAWSPYMPALCSHQGSLVLAWTGDANDRHINILTGPEGPIRLEEARSKATPALSSHQGSLVLAWCGNDGHLNLARL